MGLHLNLSLLVLSSEADSIMPVPTRIDEKYYKVPLDLSFPDFCIINPTILCLGLGKVINT